MIKIEHGKYYHIYNRGNNFEDIFRQKSDYLHFLKLTDIYITCITDVYAWALLRNHFHLLVRIKNDNEIGYLNSKNANSDDLELKWRTYDLPSSDEGGQGNVRDENSTILCPSDESMSDFPSSVGHGNVNNFTRKPKPEQQFKHFFNAYAKWYNKKYSRSGSLFTKNFERKLIDNEKYLRNLIVYIHQNPIHHGFSEHIVEYPWTSYLTIVSLKSTKLQRENVLGYFDDIANFKNIHQQENVKESILNFIIE